MSAIERSVILEALSALTNTTVKPFSKGSGSLSTFEQLTIENFLPSVFVPAISNKTAASKSCFTSLFKKLSLPNSSGSSTLGKELFVDIENFLDPAYDFDFSEYPDYDDSDECSRGGEPYTRPWGWYRFALKVLNKYPDGNAWLGSHEWRSSSSPGEWPVSFHGTTIEGAKAIASSHYKAGDRKLFGRGIYSTPDIDTAESFATEFKSKNGKTYSVIMQNRVNPKKREIIKDMDYWLVRVPEGTSAEDEKRIVEASIRPHGILIKEVKS